MGIRQAKAIPSHTNLRIFFTISTKEDVEKTSNSKPCIRKYYLEDSLDENNFNSGLQIVNPVEFYVSSASNLRADRVDFVLTVDVIDSFLPHMLEA